MPSFTQLLTTVAVSAHLVAAAALAPAAVEVAAVSPALNVTSYTVPPTGESVSERNSHSSLSLSTWCCPTLCDPRLISLNSTSATPGGSELSAAELLR